MTETSRQYPRLLIIGCDIEAGTGTGVTLSCLLKGWPRDRIAIASGDRNLGVSGFAGHYYRLGSMEDRWAWPFCTIPRESWKVSGPVTPGAKVESDGAAPPGIRCPGQSAYAGATRNGLARRLLYSAMDFTGAYDQLHSLRLSHSFSEWVCSYKPDVIYTLLGSLGLARLVSDLADTLDVPVALHFMDDWPSVIYRHGLIAPLLRRKLTIELKRLVERADVLMAISDSMSQEYRRRYGRDFLTFHNALETEDWIGTSRSSWESGPYFEVLYAGRIGTANESGIGDVAQAVEMLVKRGLNIRLTVLTSDVACPVADALTRLGCVDLIPALAHAAVPARLASADVLILPLDFGSAEQRFAKYSMPTKTVEYMASGTPVVVYAPAGHAVSRYASSEGWGLVVGNRDVPSLAEAFLSLAEDSTMREHFGRRAVEIAFINHDAKDIRAKFRESLDSAAWPRRKALPEIEP